MLPEGEVHRVKMEWDEKLPNAATFTLMREDHTMGNLIRMCAAPSEVTLHCVSRPCWSPAQATS